MFTYHKETKEVSRDGKAIGMFDETTGTVVTGTELAPVHKGQLRKILEAEGLQVKGFSTLDTGCASVATTHETKAKGDETDKAQSTKHKMSGDGGVSAGVINEGGVRGEARAGVVDECIAVPGCPPMDPRQGDKTPSVVEWFRDREPAEFERRYGRRKTHLGRS